MNKADILQLNAIPDGQEAWLSYDHYLELKRLFEAVPLPSTGQTTADRPYIDLHRFLTEVAGLKLPFNEAAIHFNAFALIRRGYRVETITAEEYKQLCRLMEALEQPSMDDLDLYDTGGHRELYNYLTKAMGLSVQRGRGPAWHRAKALMEKYETDSPDPRPD
jgi:hypothetical protein